jgi:hypothetical protein
MASSRPTAADARPAAAAARCRPAPAAEHGYADHARHDEGPASDKLRSYRIDIETDSTVFEDAEAEKAAVTEMLKASSEFVTAWMPVIQAQPAMLDLAFEMLSFALRRFKTGPGA